MRIVGIEKLNCISKKTNKPINAHIVHCLDEGIKSRDLKVGEVTKNEFVNDDIFMPFFAAYGNDYNRLLGVEIKFNYNERGYLDDLTALSPVVAGK